MRFLPTRLKTIITNPRKCRRWGQICMVIAILMNGLVLIVNLHLTSLQGELQNKRYIEKYFIVNMQTKQYESANHTLLGGISNQMVMLLRLAEDRMKPEERKTISDNIKILQNKGHESFVNSVIVTYLSVNEPPDGADVFKMFSSKSDSELVDLMKQYVEQSGEFMEDLKIQMVQLMDDISLWNSINASLLVLSSIILIIGTILNFRSDIVKPS